MALCSTDPKLALHFTTSSHTKERAQHSLVSAQCGSLYSQLACLPAEQLQRGVNQTSAQIQRAADEAPDVAAGLVQQVRKFGFQWLEFNLGEYGLLHLQQLSSVCLLQQQSCIHTCRLHRVLHSVLSLKRHCRWCNRNPSSIWQSQLNLQLALPRCARHALLMCRLYACHGQQADPELHRGHSVRTCHIINPASEPDQAPFESKSMRA